MELSRVFRLSIPGLIVLLGAELYVCWTNRLVPEDWKVRHRLFREYYQPDDTLLYKVRPNLSEFRVDWPDDDMTATYSTDASGFRNVGRDYSTSRVYFVGDSYVWGAWVPVEDSLCGYVEKDLGEPVINLGVGSYDFPRYQKLFEDLVVKYRPEIAVLSVFPNDLYLPRPIEPGTPGAGEAFYHAAGWDVFDHYPLYKKTLTYNLFDRIRRLLSSSRPGSGGDQYNQRPDRGARTASNGLTLFQYRGADRNYLVTKAAVDDVGAPVRAHHPAVGRSPHQASAAALSHQGVDVQAGLSEIVSRKRRLSPQRRVGLRDAGEPGPGRRRTLG